MKTPLDPRHKRRQKLIEELFRVEFHKQAVSRNATTVMKHVLTIDEAIRNAAKQFPIEKINRVDLAILRLAVFELIIEKKEPPKVIVDEAIELAKEYGGKASPSFINGALGNILQSC